MLKRILSVLGSSTLFMLAAAVASDYEPSSDSTEDLLFAVIVTTLLCMFGIAFLVFALNGAKDALVSGRVIEHEYKPAHTTEDVVVYGMGSCSMSPGTPIFVPGVDVQECWRIKIQSTTDRRRTTWVTLKYDPGNIHPVGSHYAPTADGASV